MMHENEKNDLLKHTGIYNYKEKNIQKLVEGTLQIRPSSFYRYRACNDYNFDALVHDYVWMSHPREYNDPDDSRIYYDALEAFSPALNTLINQWISGDVKKFVKYLIGKKEFPIFNGPAPSQLKKAAQNKKRKEYDETDHKIDFFTNKFRELSEMHLSQLEGTLNNQFFICSFSTKVDNRLMWSHYSDSHKGFCIEYATSSVYTPGGLVLPVCYLSEPIDITNQIKHSFPNGLGVGSSVIGSAMVKNDDWRYEDEWRLVLLDATDRKQVIEKPSAIYLGVNISDDNKEKALSICEEKEIPAFQMLQSKGGFGVSVGKQLA